MNPEKLYKKYLKRASKDHSNKKTMNEEMFIALWDISDVFRKDIIKYIKETESL